MNMEQKRISHPLDRAALAQTDADRVIDDFRDITDLDALQK